MDDLLELTRYRHTEIEGDKTTHRRYQGQQEVWFKIKELGSGAFGSVWLERDESGSQSRAVKRVTTQGLEIDYNKEIVALTKLRRFEEHFVYFHGWYEGPECIFLAMDYFPLGDLSQHLIDRFPEDQVRLVTHQLLHGLAVMHSLGFCHRDLKPLNIFVVRAAPAWLIKIGDFGIAKRVQDNTRLKTVIGTPAYMAPELFPYLIDDEETHPYTEAVDMWALGSVVYQMFTLRTPFGPYNPLPMFIRGKTPFPSTELEFANASADAISFLQHLLQPCPHDRSSATEALDFTWIRRVTMTDEPQEVPGQQFRHRNNTIPNRLDSIGRILPIPSANSAQYSTSAPTIEASNRWSTTDPSTALSRIVQPQQTIKRKPINEIRAVEWTRSKSLIGHEGRVCSVSFHPSEQILASGSTDKTVRVWNIAGKQLKRLKHSDHVVSVALSQRRLLASGTSPWRKPATQLWDNKSEELITSLKHENNVTSMVFLPDEKHMAIAVNPFQVGESYVELWHIESGNMAYKRVCNVDLPPSIACSPDGLCLAWKTPGTLKIQDIRAAKGAESSFSTPGHTIMYSPNGDLIAIGGADGNIGLFDLRQGRALDYLLGHKRDSGMSFAKILTKVVIGTKPEKEPGIRSISFSPNGKLLASGSHDKTVKIWDIEKRQQVAVLDGHERHVSSVAFSPNGRVVTSCSWDGTVRLWGDI